ncbi:NAD-dependent epimerase/dehydratase family protein [Undibacterium sp. Di24W]|uniref:NAD-dependent epimerase/dehydratase family protein n=1 Tax=Undibacterium sp. Di24W TaxID=3413033 RepID=UPI003BF34AE0
MERILVIGANGQIGSELVDALAAKHGAENVIAADISPTSLYGAKIYEVVDVLDNELLAKIHDKYEITQVYQLAALLSATGEKAPLKAWTLNMDGLLNILELARIRGEAGKPLKIFWPSSIAAFGPNSEAINTPQYTVMDPNTIYGISKLAGERLCEYYFQKYNVDVRSIRYPGIISYKSPPGGGTTDYAIAIFHSALKGEVYSCFLEAKQSLPMIYMPDAIRATISLMEAPAENIKIRSSYNVSGMSFNPQELTSEITKNLPNFQVHYAPDSRQAIAASWPQSLNDGAAYQDWGWKAEIDLAALVVDMLKNVKVAN